MRVMSGWLCLVIGVGAWRGCKRMDDGVQGHRLCQNGVEGCLASTALTGGVRATAARDDSNAIAVFLPQLMRDFDAVDCWQT